MSSTVNSADITAIYDAAISPDRWSQALDVVRRCTEVHSVALYDSGPNRAVEYSNRALDTRFAMQNTIQAYSQLIAGEAHSNYDQEAAALVQKKPTFSSVLDSDCFDVNDKFKARPEIDFTIRHMGVFRRFFLNLSDDPLSYSGLIAMYANHHVAPPPIHDVQIVETLAPHFGKALELHRLTDCLRIKYNAVLAALDMIATPVCILDKYGNLVLKNRKADELFSARDGVWVDKAGRLICRSDDAQEALTDATLKIALTAQGENNEQTRSLEVSRLSSDVPLFAVVSPLRDAEMELEKGLVGALLTFVDGNSEKQPDLKLLAQAYQLSDAEARVAPLLAKGLTNTEISDELEVGVETIKSHVSSILFKTQCRSRVSFVWRVFQFAPPII